MNKKLKESKNDTTERIMGLAALAIIVLGLTIIISFVWLGGTTKWMNTVGFVLLADMFLCFLLSIVLRPIKNKKIIKAVYNAAHWNAKAWGFLVALVLSAILILLGLLLIVVIPFVLVFGLLKLLSEAVTINPHTVLFGAISIGSIISAHHSRPMFWCIFKLLTMNHHRYEEHLKRMVEYVYQPTNLQVVVCFLRGTGDRYLSQS